MDSALPHRSSLSLETEVVMKILVLCGGRSAEREISLQSAAFVEEALRMAGHEPCLVEIDRSGSWSLGGSGLVLEAGSFPWSLRTGCGAEVPFEAVFPVLHGPYGEDGTVQGLCETAGWPCAGAGVLASAAGMNKAVFKRLAAAAGIPVVPWLELDERSPVRAGEILDSLGLPLFVKPARLGSSIGISRVDRREDLPRALSLAFSYDPLVVAEKAVLPAREIEVSVLGDSGGVTASVPGEIVPGREWYDFEAKYECPDSKLLIPAELEPSVTEAVRSSAVAAFTLLGGSGFARVDFLLSGPAFYLNEINTIPGFTAISMFPKLWAASGLEAPELMNRILSEALGRRPVGTRRRDGDAEVQG